MSDIIVDSTENIAVEKNQVVKKQRKPRTKKADMLKKKEAEKNLERIPKKRGRKPKGGKIVQNNNIFTEDVAENHVIILHLKCKLSDIKFNNNINGVYDIKYDPNVIKNIEAYSEKDMKNNYFTLSSNEEYDHKNEHKDEDGNENKLENIVNDGEVFIELESNKNESYKQKQKDKRNISKKLKELEHKFSMNQGDKKSACFWCTCDFTTHPIHIPSLYYKEKYDVYGCFCSPECAAAYLFKENIDTNTKFERYQLLNYLYGEVYGYKKDIKQAPNPFYTLDKYYGTLTIQEYRQLLDYERVILVINKPVTKIFPEIHEDNNDFETIYENKVSLKKNTKNYKKDALKNAFTLSDNS